MSMTRPFLLVASASLAAVFATVTIAEAQTRGKKRQTSAEPTRTLTVKQRSFLDSGKVVRVGSESGYAQAGTVLSRPLDVTGNRSRHGGETLPRRFDVPSQALFNF